ncbi:MAG: molybdopterin-dependent oxidoreductase [Actinobacteria bacterium]|nr:molybdopterin-dependent oxidoreductase [Actinomycetota bacterium]
MGRKPLLLLIIAAILVAASVFLFIFRQAGGEDRLVVEYDEVLSMPSVEAVYHSINNWQTVEDTWFEGVVLHSFLEDRGIDEGDAEIKLIAPDGYFWPAVDTVLTLDDLREANAEGLYPLLAWEMNGQVLQPEPDGSGPLRLVMPQYAEDEINKPSWVSNLRLIEVGPLDEGSEAPDAMEVPPGEVWIYGNIPAVYPFPVILPVVLLLAGIVLLAAAMVAGMTERRKKRSAAAGAAAVVLALAFLAGNTMLITMQGDCRADPGSRVFSMAELKSMPAFSGHYTFLKSQEPFTYYEDDYKGVPLSYIIEEKMNLAPGASEVTIKARDNYSKTLTLAQVRATYPGDLKVIIAYERNGSPLSGDEPGIRLIVPQTVPGNKEQGGDANTPLCVRMVYAVEVSPVPAGEQAPAAGSVPEGSLAVYGAVVEPAPAPAPEPQPQPQPAPSPQPQPEDQADIQQEEAPDEVVPAVKGAASLITDPLGAFSVNWMVIAATQVRPFAAVLPLAYLLYREGGIP